MNLHEAISLYRLQLEANGRSEHTIAQAERHLRRFREWLGDGVDRGNERTVDDGDDSAGRDVDTIDATLVARFFVSDAARLGANGAAKKATSMNAMRSSLRAFFRFLHDCGYVRSDPTRLVRRAICGTPPPRDLSIEEQRRLLGAVAACTDANARRDLAMFKFMLATGARVSTVLSLDVDDLDRESNEVAVRVMKGGAPNRVPAPIDVMELLIELAAGRVAGPLFISQSGVRLGRRHVDRRLKLWARRAGILRSIHAHQFRHTVAQRVFDATNCVLTVASVLCHASVSSSTRYARIGPQQLRRVVGDSWKATMHAFSKEF